ncbi:hypothetical protein RND81_14G172300 [Saponaria officinalis]|uniref:Uncharacterized protein n=1 Tax=Saponaria officinalis TaxID=3572 RepID=A0AAW1GXB1_SAPOF
MPYPILSAQKSTLFKNPKSKPIPPYILHCQFSEPTFTNRRRLAVQTTTVYHISSVRSVHYDSPWIIAAVKGADKSQFLHPLTLKHHHYNLPDNFNLFHHKFNHSTLASFHNTEFNFDKLVIPLPKSKKMSDNTMLVLYGGGKLIGRPFLIDEEKWTPWITLSDDSFDDIVVVNKYNDPKIYAVDREGVLFFIKKNITSRVMLWDRVLVTGPDELGPGQVGWRKRLVAGWTVVSGERDIYIWWFVWRRNYFGFIR